MQRMTISALAILCGLLTSGCGDDGEADATAPLVGMLLDEEAVVEVFPELGGRSQYSTGEDYGEIRPDDVAGGPVEEATAGVVRQWSTDYSRSHDEPARPQVFSVTSMVLQFPTAEAAEDAADALVASIEGEGGEMVEHARLDAAVTSSDDLVTAVGATAVEDRVVTVQVDGAERIEADALNALLDATAEQLP